MKNNPTQNHYQLSDTEFALQFESLTLPPGWFTHEAHLRLAWIYIKKYGAAGASEKLCEQIKVFDQTFGSGKKFNKTVTFAFVQMIHFHQSESGCENFQDFIRLYPELITSYRDLLSRHYSMNLFNDEVAKHEFVEPDVRSFPSL